LSATGGSLILRSRLSLPGLIRNVATSARFYVYSACTFLAVLVSYHLGKEMLWDTMDYHIYAGFSALHDRFGQDYFAAGPQAYFNPYSFVPFYLLLRSALTPLEDASILAALQSVILWLTYELAIAVAPLSTPRMRLATGILAVALAFANPVLINQLGSSFNDVTTGAVALAGWVLLLAAVRDPSVTRVTCAGLLLGAATALKPTNAVHAVSALAILPFIRGNWRTKLRYTVSLIIGVGTAFSLISAPWSVQLEHQFGNPVFPLLNVVFRSPEFSMAPMVAYRFIPASFTAALLRPFEMAVPAGLIHVEWVAPDLRYAFLSVFALLLALRWVWQRLRKNGAVAPSAEEAAASRMQAALGFGFLADWLLWLTASGNSRYFIPMACVAAVLGVALAFRLLSARPAVRNYLIAAVFGAQLYQLHAGTEYRASLPWPARHWFSLSIPRGIASQPSLYFMVGEQSNSYIIPYLPRASGFINLDGEYTLSASGPNGVHIQSLIDRFGTHLRVLLADPRGNPGAHALLPSVSAVSDALKPFGLKVGSGRCTTIVARGVTGMWNSDVRGSGARPSSPYTQYLVSCPVIRYGSGRIVSFPGQQAADLAFDHLEDACPALFQPRRPADRVLGDKAHGYLFERRYADTEVVAWIAHGWVRFLHYVGGAQAGNAGRESAWKAGTLRVACTREGGYSFKLLQPFPAGSE
jgi:hypothetical protein